MKKIQDKTIFWKFLTIFKVPGIWIRKKSQVSNMEGKNHKCWKISVRLKKLAEKDSRQKFIFENFRSSRNLDLTKFYNYKFFKIYKFKFWGLKRIFRFSNSFCLDSFSGHFKKKLFFSPTENFQRICFFPYLTLVIFSISDTCDFFLSPNSWYLENFQKC